MEILNIQVTNKRTLELLYQLEALHLIKVLRGKPSLSKEKLSEKYKNVFSEKDAASFMEHTEKMREEWDNT